MSSTITNTITGIVFLIFLWKTTIAQGQTHSCMVDETIKIARCSDGAIKNGMIPQDLVKSIEILIISNNTNMTEITSSSFSNYGSLITLEMRNLLGNGNTLAIQKDALLSLSKLENVDMTGTPLPSNINITWPESLRNLSIAGCGLSTVDVQGLKQLIFFNASYNRLEKFPKFAYLAPLYGIDLWNNSIKTMECIDVAPYCNLTFFNISFSVPQEGIQSEKNICECKNLVYWLSRFMRYVTNNELKCADENMTGTVGNSKSKCIPPMMATERYLQIRRLCVHRLLLEVTTLYRVIIGSVFIIVTLTLLALAYAKPVKIPKVIETHPFEAHSTTPKSSPDIDHSTSPHPSTSSTPHP